MIKDVSQYLEDPQTHHKFHVTKVIKHYRNSCLSYVNFVQNVTYSMDHVGAQH
jgi:hypothetical protein